MAEIKLKVDDFEVIIDPSELELKAELKDDLKEKLKKRLEDLKRT